MTNPADLAEAHKLLGQFEKEMEREDHLPFLIDGLALLAGVRDSSVSTFEQQVATNVALSYARKAAANVQRLLSEEPRIHHETLRHWGNIFSEFERAEFQLPTEVANVHSSLNFLDAQRSVESMSPSERETLLNLLQASLRKGDS